MSNVLLSSEAFGALFLVGNALTARSNRHLAGSGTTLVQWQLCAALSRQPRHSANLTTLASLLCTSRQNVKQVARGLQAKGFLTLGADPRDSRAVVVNLTPACDRFWADRATEDTAFLETLFTGFTDDELRQTTAVLERLYQKLKGVDE